MTSYEKNAVNKFVYFRMDVDFRKEKYQGKRCHSHEDKGIMKINEVNKFVDFRKEKYQYEFLRCHSSENMLNN